MKKMNKLPTTINASLSLQYIKCTDMNVTAVLIKQLKHQCQLVTSIVTEIDLLSFNKIHYIVLSLYQEFII